MDAEKMEILADEALKDIENEEEMKIFKNLIYQYEAAFNNYVDEMRIEEEDIKGEVFELFCAAQIRDFSSLKLLKKQLNEMWKKRRH